jgi:hypothetical protein
MEMTRDITKQILRNEQACRKIFLGCKWLLLLLNYLNLKILMGLVFLGVVTCDNNIV